MSWQAAAAENALSITSYRRIALCELTLYCNAAAAATSYSTKMTVN